MLVYITCNYCDHKWDKQVYAENTLKTTKCPSCGDSSIKVKHPKDSIKINYYEGSPDFPPPKYEKDEYDTYL